MDTVAIHELREAQSLITGVRAVLQSPCCQTAIAEIWDGMPISSHYYGDESAFATPHPDITARSIPSDGGLQMAKLFADEFEITALRVDSKASSLLPASLV